MHDYLRKLIVFLIFLQATLSFSQTAFLEKFSTLNEFTEKATTSEWKIAKKKDGIVLKYRRLHFENDFHIRELSAEFTVQTSEKELESYIKFPKKIEKWNENVKNVKILEDSNKTWITYMEYNIPHLFSQQDLVAKYNSSKKNNITIIDACAKPNFIPKINGIKREEFYLSEWKIEPINSGELKVTFSVVSYSSSKIPKFIKDPIIQDKLIKSFENLKKRFQ